MQLQLLCRHGFLLSGPVELECQLDLLVHHRGSHVRGQLPHVQRRQQRPERRNRHAGPVQRHERRSAEQRGLLPRRREQRGNRLRVVQPEHAHDARFAVVRLGPCLRCLGGRRGVLQWQRMRSRHGQRLPALLPRLRPEQPGLVREPDEVRGVSSAQRHARLQCLLVLDAGPRLQHHRGAVLRGLRLQWLLLRHAHQLHQVDPLERFDLLPALSHGQRRLRHVQHFGLVGAGLRLR